jgi:hypothetical protein
MEGGSPMPILRLAYVTLFLIALIAVFVLWSEVGGQGHLDLLPWSVKLALGGGAAFACVQATAAAVSGKQAWNRRALRWCGLLLALLVACGLAAWYSHVYLETDEDQDQNDTPGSAAQVTPAALYIFAGPRLKRDGRKAPRSWEESGY